VWREFKEFALKGNMVDLALGLVVGSAGANIIASLVKGILIPRLHMLLGGTDPRQLPPVDIDAVLSSIISFLLNMIVVFFIVKVVNRMKKGFEPEPVEKECPHCFFNIPIQATRCGHCTSQLEAVA
jgi:large conductance mechanosensitive channel